jgi:hypothetical protein
MSIESNSFLSLESLKALAFDSSSSSKTSAEDQKVQDIAGTALGMRHKTSSSQTHTISSEFLTKIKAIWGNDFEDHFTTENAKKVYAHAILDCVNAGLSSVNKKQIFNFVRSQGSQQNVDALHTSRATEFSQTKAVFENLKKIADPTLQKAALFYLLEQLLTEPNIGYRAELRLILGSQIPFIHDEEAQNSLVQMLLNSLGDLKGDPSHQAAILKLLCDKLPDMYSSSTQQTILDSLQFTLTHLTTPSPAVYSILNTTLLSHLKSANPAIQTKAAKIFILYLTQEGGNELHKTDLKAEIRPYIEGISDPALARKLDSLCPPDEEVELLNK